MREQVLEMLREHYSAADAAPYWLARLGQWLSREGIAQNDGTPLSEWASSALKPEFVVVADPAEPARRAVVPHDKKENVLREWADDRSESEDILRRFPRAILVAFHVRPEDPDKRVYVQMSPARYQVAYEPPGVGWHEIEAKYRPNEQVFFTSVGRLSPEERRGLRQRVLSWMAEVELDESDLSRARRWKEEPQSTPPTVSALERLISAQPKELQRQIVVPADIALLLMKRP